MTRPPLRLAAVVLAFTMLAACGRDTPAPPEQATVGPDFGSVQPVLFGVWGAQPNAWADYDLDGDLDLFVGFRGRANRLYDNDAGVFTDVAAEVGLADEADTRAAAWGDYDLDGDLDLYVGFAAEAGEGNRLYRNDTTEEGSRFVDVAADLGLDRVGTTRQPVFVDVDGDGDPDLFVAFRDQPNRLYRNERGTFTDVTDGVGDRRSPPHRRRRLVRHGRGRRPGPLHREPERRRGRRVPEPGRRDVHGRRRRARHEPAGRTEEQGSVGVAVSDYDNDGDLDLFVPSYGADVLWQNQGDGTFVDVAGGTPSASDHHSVAAAWGDIDNDGWVDLYVDRYLNTEAETPDALFRNQGGVFQDVTPQVMLEKGGTHGVAWADFDLDGDLDLALANNSEPDGTHPLYRNRLPRERAARALQVMVLDNQSHWARAGAQVVLEEEMGDGTPGAYRSARLIDAGGGYSSQGAAPVHFAIPDGVDRVRVTVAWFEGGQRRTGTVTGVDPAMFQGRWLVLRLGLQ